MHVCMHIFLVSDASTCYFCTCICMVDDAYARVHAYVWFLMHTHEIGKKNSKGTCERTCAHVMFVYTAFAWMDS
jgi:hypothetical protein